MCYNEMEMPKSNDVTCINCEIKAKFSEEMILRSLPPKTQKGSFITRFLKREKARGD